MFTIALLVKRLSASAPKVHYHVYKRFLSWANMTLQNYWIFGLFPLSGILDTRKHKVSETGSVFVLR
jgi:hypothetical protein